MVDYDPNPLAFWQRQVGDNVTGFKGNHWRSKSMSSLAEEEEENNNNNNKLTNNNNNNKINNNTINNNNNNNRRDNNVLVEVIVVEEKSLEHVPAFQTDRFFDDESPEEEKEAPSPRDLPSKIPVRVRTNSQCESPEPEEPPFSPPEHRPLIKPHVAPDWCISTKFKPTPAELIPSPPKKRPLLRSQSEFTGVVPPLILGGTSSGHRRASTAPRATDYTAAAASKNRRPSMPLRATINFQSSTANYTPAPLVERSPRGSDADKSPRDEKSPRPKRVYSRSNSLDRPASSRRDSQNLPANFHQMNVNGAATKTSSPANFRRMNTEQTPSAAERRQRLQRASSVEAIAAEAEGGSSPRRPSLQKMVYVGPVTTNGERQVSNGDRSQLRRISNGDRRDSNVPISSTTNIPNVRMRVKKNSNAKDENRRRSNAF